MVGVAAIIERSPGVRSAVRAVANLVNPLVVLIAGRRWMPIVGILHHVGRRSGKSYSTPLGMRRLGGLLFIPRTFGDNAAWFRNLLAAGSVDVTYLGARQTVGLPEVVTLTRAAAAFPRYERAIFRMLGIGDFLLLRSHHR